MLVYFSIPNKALDILSAFNSTTTPHSGKQWRFTYVLRNFILRNGSQQFDHFVLYIRTGALGVLQQQATLIAWFPWETKLEKILDSFVKPNGRDFACKYIDVLVTPNNHCLWSVTNTSDTCRVNFPFFINFHGFKMIIRIPKMSVEALSPLLGSIGFRKNVNKQNRNNGPTPRYIPAIYIHW